MKIKNIQEYRSFYKNEIRDVPTRDENFIGNFLIEKHNGKKKFGWFDIYHGDKEGYGKAESGIENFLQSFLDMAKDGQAVYEFLQNAVDSGSTHFSMVWGKDEIDGNHYLLVANNGKMFNLDSIRSILNVGSSTKTNDSQTIGKFGIGFKLAHRLVGKDNGLQELINENSGPILFSWKNYEIENLANTESLEPQKLQYRVKESGNYEVQDDNPWLFKILITCFPCLPQNDTVNELPKMANGEPAMSNPFSRKEYEALSRWVKNNQSILNKETYNEGALFFIKLGSGKEEELAEVNLNKGVKFAIAILKETSPDHEKNSKLLQTVQLNNDEAITYPNLEYVKLSIDKEQDKDTYAHVRFGVDSFEDLNNEQKRKIKEEADIEALFGFKKHNEIGDYFKGAPNLYLHFPLSEEVHNFNYILHSNAFYKGSSRTFLHTGNSKEDGINERLLKVIVEKIELKLIELSNSQKPLEKDLFLHFYAALLTSGKSTNQYRLWIEKPYIDPVNILLNNYIPVRTLSNTDGYTIIKDIKDVFIKKTDIDINPETWNLKDVNWYYWNVNNTDIIAKSVEKLGIAEYTIFDLLKNEGIDNYINTWLNGDDKKIKLVLQELSVFEGNVSVINQIRPQLLKLNLFRFSNGEVLSLSAFSAKENEGYLLLHSTLGNVKEILIKAGLITTELDLSIYKFVEIYRTYLLQASKHKGYTELTQLFSNTVQDENLKKLSKSEKLKLFNAFRTINSDNITERIKELKLFNNNSGRPVAFKSLLANQSENWLNSFSISATEYDSQLKSYLLDDKKEFYQSIIYPYWSDILKHIAKNKNNVKEIISEITTLFHDSKWSEKQQHLLSNKDLIIYNAEVINSDNIFFNQSLISLTDEQFIKVQEVSLKLYEIQIPDKFLLNYLDEIPLSYASININASIENTVVSIDEINNLMLLCSNSNIDFFETNTIFFKDNTYVIDSTSELKQFSTDKPHIINYVSKHYPNQFILIPETVNIEKGKIKLSDTTLVVHLIELYNKEIIEQELDLIELVLNERYDDKKALLHALTHLKLDTNWVEERQNELYLNLLNDVLIDTFTPEELVRIQEKTLIYNGEVAIVIGTIDSAQDTIEVKRGDKNIYLSQSQILNLDNANTIKLIQEFHDTALIRNLIHPAKADKLFKISKVGISDALILRFENNLKSLGILKDALPINNSHQLSFVLLSGRYSGEDLKKFAVKCQDDNWYFLKNVKIINSDINKKYIDDSSLLDESYQGLQSLLSLSDTEVFNYGENENDILLSRFLFVKGITPEVLNENEDLPEQLDYLYSGWKNLPLNSRDNKRSGQWETVFGLNPNQYIFNGLHCQNEILPEEFLKWHNNEKQKDDFFKALGVYVNNSPIEKIRSFLIGHTQDEPIDIELKKFNDVILCNTIKGLTGEFVILNKNPVVFEEIIDDRRLALCENLINDIVSKELSEFPVLIYNSTNSFRIVDNERPLYVINYELHLKLKSNDNNLPLLYNEYNIIKNSLSLNDKIIEHCTKLIFSKDFIPNVHASEHNEPFYYNWKTENKISLFKQDELNFNYSIAVSGKNISVGIAAEGKFHINQTDDFTEIFYDKSLTLEDLSTALSQENSTLAQEVNNLIAKRNMMLASIYNALNAAGKSEVKSAHLQALEAAFKEENLKQERKSLIDNIKDNTQYSYIWFESYLKFLLTFESKQDTINQKSISFQEIKRYVINDEISNRYFLLCGASSLVPLNIEDFDDFKITLVVKNRQNENLKVEGVSKRGQDLLVFCREAIPQTTINKFNDVIQVKISFSPVIDLLERLHKAFVNESNISQWDDIKEVLPNLEFIYGPPGTGKTTTLCSKIIDGIIQNNNAKYLLLTPTNKAADVLCKKIIKPSNNKSNLFYQKLEQYQNEGKSVTLTRIGKPTDPELEEIDKDIYQNSPNLQQLQCTNVVASTIHRIPYFDIVDPETLSNIKLFKLEKHWDYVIFDEASMINLPYLVFAILAIRKFCPDAKFIIAGDPKQIPPVVDVNDKDLEEIDIQDENVYRMMNINSFNSSDQFKRENDSIINLSTQYRSIKQIGQLFSDLSYNNLLKHDREEQNDKAKPLPEAFKKIFSKNVNFVDIPLNSDESIYRINKLIYSPYHIYSAIFVAEIVKRFASLLKDGENWTIGLIAPYKAQAILLNKLITSYNISDKLKIYSDTVHGFQGDECDIVFFISNPNNYNYSGHPKCLLSKEYIYNVAISRARDYLIILHPFEAIQNNKFINSIVNSYTTNFGTPSLVKSSDIEKILFQQKDFIKKNSYITGHDNINVFGQIEMKYFIKANENAIDIQLRKI